jgi:hypothetical protein
LPEAELKTVQLEGPHEFVPFLVSIGAAGPVTLPATPMKALAAIDRVRDVLLKGPQAEIPTEHVIHGGMYARTVRLPKDAVIVGCLYKVPTMLTVNGHAMVCIADGWAELNGFNVIPASRGRKQLFVALGPVEITMVFATQAQTVEEAEAEMTDESDLLLSRRQDSSTVTITGE